MQSRYTNIELHASDGFQGWASERPFLLASTTNPASVGGARGWGIGTATPDSIAVSLSNGGLLAVGNDEARNELVHVLKEWHEQGEPGLVDLTPSFTRDEDGWAVRLRLRSRV